MLIVFAGRRRAPPAAAAHPHLPRRAGWVASPAPPDFILKAQGVVGMALGQRNQPVSGCFFRTYSGSGLLIHCLARFGPHPQPLERTAHRFPADPDRRQTLPKTNLGRLQLHGPQAGLVAKVPRTLVQRRPQPLRLFRIEARGGWYAPPRNPPSEPPSPSG